MWILYLLGFVFCVILLAVVKTHHKLDQYDKSEQKKNNNSNIMMF